MKRSRLYLALIIAAAAGFLVYILFPLTSRKWDLKEDPGALEAKKKALDASADTVKMSGRAAGPAGRRPNIIILLADDLGKTEISLYRGRKVETPNIDSIGRQGVIFTNAYCTASICSPSRSSLLTGRYQQRFGNELQIAERYPLNRIEYFMYKYFVPTGRWKVRDLERYPSKKQMAKQGPPLSEILLPELLKTAGYRTGITGKWHQGWAEEMVPGSRGFDYQYGFYEAYSLYGPVDNPGIINSRHDYFADKHIWQRGRKGTSAVRRNNRVIKEENYFTFAVAEEAVAYMEGNKEGPFLLYVPFSAPHTPFQAPKEYYNMFRDEPDHNKRVYYAMIKALDDAVGQILAGVADNGLEEDTLIFFASDNGGAVYTGAADNSPGKDGKFTLYEGGLAVPMMMQWRGTFPENTVSGELVSLMDMFATACSAAGLPLPADRVYDSLDLTRLAIPADNGIENPPPFREALYFRSGFNKAIRKGDWKLLILGRDKRTELYNLAEDWEEKHNLADRYPEIVVDLACMLNRWEEELLPPLWPSVMDYRTTIDGREYNFQL